MRLNSGKRLCLVQTSIDKMKSTSICSFEYIGSMKDFVLGQQLPDNSTIITAVETWVEATNFFERYMPALLVQCRVTYGGFVEK